FEENLARIPSATTVGAFYRAIAREIERQGDGIFTGDPKRQVVEGISGMFAVTCKASALDAINEIVEQGEGTLESPRGKDDKLAHYYRFLEIKYGHRFNEASGSRARWDDRSWYTGKAVPFEESGVYKAPCDLK